MTAHKSKGLEADEVIVINCKNGLLRFSNQTSIINMKVRVYGTIGS